MSTTIEWTNEVWNPTTGCNKVSRGCKNCYAEKMHKRLQGMKMPGYHRNFLEGAYPNPAALNRPLKWKRPKKVFLDSMSDLFHHNIPFEYVDKVFAVMALTPQHIYQILTKRPERMAEYMTSSPTQRIERHLLTIHQTIPLNQRVHGYGKPRWPLPNVWLGTSVENQAAADERIPHLLKCPAAVRFLSCEPLVGPVNFASVPEEIDEDARFAKRTLHGIHWVIVGGESGSKATPMHPDWARSLRDQCEQADVLFFFKQWGEYAPLSKQHLKLTHSMFPDGSTIAWGSSESKDLIKAMSSQDYDTLSAYSKVGKHHSGRLLDGKEHNEYPTGNATSSHP
jgi:protein gp37